MHFFNFEINFISALSAANYSRENAIDLTHRLARASGAHASDSAGHPAGVEHAHQVHCMGIVAGGSAVARPALCVAVRRAHRLLGHLRDDWCVPPLNFAVLHFKQRRACFCRSWSAEHNAWRRGGQPSAYSVFNRNCESLDGALTAAQFEQELRCGWVSVFVVVVIGAGSARRAWPASDDGCHFCAANEQGVILGMDSDAPVLATALATRDSNWCEFRCSRITWHRKISPGVTWQRNIFPSVCRGPCAAARALPLPRLVCHCVRVHVCVRGGVVAAIAALFRRRAQLVADALLSRDTGAGSPG